MRSTGIYIGILLLAPSLVMAKEFPTIETVRYVVDCMVKNGGQNEENLYACTCRFDSMSAELSFAEYEQVSVYLRNKAMPGEKGAVFRDLGSGTKKVREKYDALEKKASAACPIVKRVVRTKAE